jgi:hypothetical protein
MSPAPTIEHCRSQLADLVARAVPESDPDRRRELLEQADHWGRLLRSQREGRAPAEPRSFAEPAPTGGGRRWAFGFWRS